jgi:uncharacterized membrane protein
LTLEVARIAHIDVPALLAVIGALALLPLRPRLAGLLLGVSLAIKHIAVLLVPLFLIWAWTRRRRWRDVVEQGVWIALLPALLTLPFLLWDVEALLRTLLFPMTRLPAQTVGASSLDVRLGLVGLPAKLPMLLLFAGVYGLAWRGLVNRWAAAFLIFAVFTGYNSPPGPRPAPDASPRARAGGPRARRGRCSGPPAGACGRGSAGARGDGAAAPAPRRRSRP